jgi:Spy/CpxP family protein refolding chaperone
MKKNILIGMVAVVAMTLVASMALAGPGFGRGMGYGPGYGNPPVANLTPEQSSKIQAIQQANFKEIGPIQEQLFAKRTELRNLWLSQNPDPGRIDALQKEMLAIRTELQEKSTSARLEMRKVLTPEQQAQLSASGRGMGRMGGRMGRW